MKSEMKSLRSRQSEKKGHILGTASGKRVSPKHIHLSLSGLWSKRYAVKGESYNLNKYKTVDYCNNRFHCNRNIDFA